MLQCCLALVWLGFELHYLVNFVSLWSRGSLDAAEAPRNLAAFSQAGEGIGLQVDLGSDVVCEQVDVVKLLKQTELGCQGITDR